MRGIRLLIWAVALGPLAGCYSYATLGGWDALTVGGDIRARVTETAKLRLDGVLPEHDNRVEDSEVEGKIVELSQADLVLLVKGIDETGFRQDQLGQRFVITRTEVLGLESMRLDTWKTGIAATVATAALTALVLRQFTGFFGGTGPAPGGPDPVR